MNRASPAPEVKTFKMNVHSEIYTRGILDNRDLSSAGTFLTWIIPFFLRYSPCTDDLLVGAVLQVGAEALQLHHGVASPSLVVAVDVQGAHNATQRVNGARVSGSHRAATLRAGGVVRPS